MGLFDRSTGGILDQGVLDAIMDCISTGSKPE